MPVRAMLELRERIAGARRERPARLPSAVLPVVGIERTGVILRTDGVLVRILRVTPRDARLLTGDELEALIAGLASLCARLATGGAQVYVESGAMTTRTGRAAPGAPPAPTRQPNVYVVLRTPGARSGRGRRGASRRRDARHRALLRAEAARTALAHLGLAARMLDGSEAARLLVRRFQPTAAGDDRPLEVLGELDDHEEAAGAARAVADLRVQLASLAPDFSPRHVTIGAQVEQAIQLVAAPETTRPGWLLERMPARRPSWLSLHIRAPVDGTPDPRITLYQVIRETGTDREIARLADAADTAVRRLADGAGASVHGGEFRQQQLWRSTLPLADDSGEHARSCPPARIAVALPLLGTVDPAVPRLRRLVDPFDLGCATSSLLVTGARAREVSGTLLDGLVDDGLDATLVLGSRRARPLPPGTEHERLGVTATVNPWDTADQGPVGHEKVATLMALHELLLGPGALVDARVRHALTRAIGVVYARAARSGRAALERDLPAAMRAVAAHEPWTSADTLQRVLDRLAPLVGDGDYANWLDRRTELPDARVLALDAGEAPAHVRPALALIGAEHALIRAARRRVARPPGHAILLDADAMLDSSAAAAWLARAARRARNAGAFVIVAAERLERFAAPEATPALRAFGARLALREDADALTASALLGLSAGEARAIAALEDDPQAELQAHWIAGSRGRAIVALELGEQTDREPAGAA